MHELALMAAEAANPFEQFGEWLSDSLLWILSLVQSVDPLLRTLLAGFGILLETSVLVGLVIPGDTIVIVAATGVGSPLEYFGLAISVIVGALCGESIGFALGHFFGPKIRASRLGRRLGEHNWVRAENYVNRRGGLAVFISRFLPVLHSLIPLTVGMSGMKYRTFMAWTAPACTIWSFLYVSVGTFAVGSFTALLDQLHYAGYLFVGVILLFSLAALGVKKWLEKAEARHMDRPLHPGTDTPTTEE